ncbi:MAG TPA: hypothetical protein VF212_14560 [Longimicrobiales bacterium]
MHDPVERCAREVLRADAALTVPLSRLHRALVAEAGPSAGTYGQLHDRLRRSPERFALIESPPLPWDAAPWPDDERRSYLDALYRVGVVAEPRVLLRDGGAVAAGGAPGPAADAGPGVAPVLRSADASLVALWSAIGADPADHAPVAEAMVRVDELRAAAARVADAAD